MYELILLDCSVINFPVLESIILIDDTDVERINEQVVFSNGISGKGKLVIPQAIKDGYNVIFSGRQTLLSK